MMEFYIQIFVQDGEFISGLVDPNSRESIEWLIAQLEQGYNYWEYYSDDPEFVVYVFYPGKLPTESEIEEWNETAVSQALDWLEENNI